MRIFPLIVCASLALCACGEKNSAEQSANGTQDITAESIGGNDMTAIDAATASDAQMAADVEFNLPDLNALEGNGGDSNSADDAD